MSRVLICLIVQGFYLTIGSPFFCPKCHAATNIASDSAVDLQPREEADKNKGNLATPNGKTPLWITISSFLSVSGMIGGLGWHLVNNKGNLTIPYKVMGSRNTPEFHLGFLSDVFIGFVTANSLHLAIAGIVDYQNATLDSQKENRIYFSLIALGILSGFGGGPLLTALSRQLRNTLTPDEQKKEIAKQLAPQLELTEVLNIAQTALASDISNPQNIIARKEALRKIEEISKDVLHVRTLAIYHGRLYRQLGNLSAGIDALTRTLEIRRKKGIPKDKDDAALLFNRSCYQTLESTTNAKDELLKRAWEDLQICVKLDPTVLEQAKTDDDLAALREKFDFNSLNKAA